MTLAQKLTKIFMPQRQGWAYMALTVLLLVLLVGTLMPGSLKGEIEGHFWQGLPWSSLAHFGLFGALAALPVYGRGWGAFGRAALLALLLAAATELLQAWMPGRHPLWRDAAIDLSGALVGYALGFRLRSLRYSCRP